MNLIVFLNFLLLFYVSHSSINNNTVYGGVLVFQTGFEDNVYTDKPTCIDRIDGVDIYVDSKGDFTNDLKPDGLTINYVCGDCTQRNAQIVDDPEGTINSKTGIINKVLHFYLREAPYCSANARVQTHLSSINFWEFSQVYKMFIHSDMSILNSYPENVGWNMFQEIWSTKDRGGEWGGGKNFRISFDMVKASGTSTFYFAVGATQCCSPSETFWHFISRTDYGGEYNVTVPIGEWFEVETYFKVGDSLSGRVILVIKRESEDAKQTVFNLTVPTSHPEDNELSPLEHWMPHKLYVSEDILEYVRTEGGALQLYFDDWKVYTYNNYTFDCDPPCTGNSVCVLGTCKDPNSGKKLKKWVIPTVVVGGVVLIVLLIVICLIIVVVFKKRGKSKQYSEIEITSDLKDTVKSEKASKTEL